MARAEQEVARAHGIRRSEFLSWSESDRAWALALHDLDADTCPGCGHPRSESTAADAEYAYTATPTRCHACATQRRAERAFLDGADSPAADGLAFHILRDG